MHSLNTIPNKKFGLFIAVTIFVIAIYQGFHHFFTYFWAPLLSLSFLAFGVALFAPSLFNRLNNSWFLLGRYMGLIVSPIAIGFIYFLIITPISLLTGLFGRDELLLKRPKVASYWIAKDKSPEHNPSYKNQF